MIDFNFIGRLEGGCSTKGYVPNPDGSISGVTIATGVDLGQMGQADLDKLNLPDTLKKKLIPYLGIKKFEAVEKINELPLEISLEEAKMLDKEIKAQLINRLAQRYEREANVPFESLPDGVQTVIASVSFQYGDLQTRTPNFWRQITHEDWHGAYRNLRDFGDAYATRRNQEADLLRSSLGEIGQDVD